jgi:hypothetical protein
MFSSPRQGVDENYSASPRGNSSFGMTAGRKRQMSDEWKERARARLARGDITHRQAEKQMGAGSGTISRMLDPDKPQRTSEFVDALSAVLGIDLPITETRGADEEQVIARFRALGPGEREAVLRILGLAKRDPD